jgi:endonuclease/exonuclease/phosphatase family metal-dependent hydrolase
MSFNVRFAYPGHSESEPENNWNDAAHPRRERTIRVIRDYMPDILGVQEARHRQIVDLREALPEYDFYGVARDDGKQAGEYTGIFYRRQRLEHEKEGSFWLSDTPEKPGTTFYKAPNAVPRMASWVRFRDKPTKTEFIVLNTHFDHISESARRKSARLIRKRLAELSENLPTIVMGDFNAHEDTPAITTLIGKPALAGGVWIDSYRKLNPRRLTEESTFSAWAGKKKGSRIDFILHTADFTPTAAEIVRTSYDGRWPSDHYPVTATLRLEK